MIHSWIKRKRIATDSSGFAFAFAVGFWFCCWVALLLLVLKIPL